MINRIFYYFMRVRMICNIKNIILFIKCHIEFSKDKNYSLINLIKSMILVSKDEKIIKYNGKFIVSSFLPPFPSEAFQQLFNAVPGKDSIFYEHTHAKRSAPISMFISLTDSCNYHCWHCSKAHRTKHDDLSLETIKKLISDLQDMGVSIIGLTGGDPLLRNDLEEIIKSIDKRSVSILYTTGQTLTMERTLKLKDAGLFAIGISLDHHKEDVHNSLRGNLNAYRDAMNAIAYSKDAGLYTMIQTVATKKMIEENEIWNLIFFAEKLNVHEIRILESMPSGKLLHIDKKNLLTKKERDYLMDVHKKANKNWKGPKVSVFAHTESPERFGCGAATQHSYIDSVGNLNPCDFVPLSFGNITEQPIQELWKEMNTIIGVPRDLCFIHEIYSKIADSFSTTLPLDTGTSRDICLGCRKMDKLPGFYETLMGKKKKKISLINEEKEYATCRI